MNYRGKTGPALSFRAELKKGGKVKRKKAKCKANNEQ
jgi:hypothetical protein